MVVRNNISGNKVVQLGLSGDINIKMGQATVTIAAAGSFSSVDQTLVLRLNSSALIPRVLGIKALSFQNVGGELQLTPAAPFLKQLSLNATVLLGTDPMWAIKGQVAFTVSPYQPASSYFCLQFNSMTLGSLFSALYPNPSAPWSIGAGIFGINLPSFILNISKEALTVTPFNSTAMAEKTLQAVNEALNKIATLLPEDKNPPPPASLESQAAGMNLKFADMLGALLGSSGMGDAAATKVLTKMGLTHAEVMVSQFTMQATPKAVLAIGGSIRVTPTGPSSSLNFFLQGKRMMLVANLSMSAFSQLWRELGGSSFFCLPLLCCITRDVGVRFS